MFLDPAWGSRIAVAIDNAGGSVGTVDAEVTVPPELDAFWKKVKSGAEDVRFTQADGRTLLAFKRQTWTYASQVGVFQLSAVPSKDAQLVAWMYWRNASATDVAASPTINTPKPASIWPGRLAALTTVRALPEAWGATRARTRLVKTTAEKIRVFWDFSARLEGSLGSIGGGRRLEEIRYVVGVDVLNTNKESQAGTMVNLGKTRAHEGAVSTWLQAGSAGTYSLVCQVETTLGRVLEARARLQVNNVEV